MSEPANASNDLEQKVQAWGEKIFSLIETAEPPSFFTKKGLSGALMDWAMRDDHFKTQLFRFVDVLPTLTSSGEVSRHLKEYLDSEGFSPAVRAGLKAASLAPWVMAPVVKAQVTAMARQFMLGDDAQEILAALRGLHDRQIDFTVDLLGEAVLSEADAGQYAGRYLDMLALLAREIAGWPGRDQGNVLSSSPVLNISVKISALYSQIHPADPETAIECISGRLRPMLRKAKETGALVNFDMESYALKNLTLRLFKTIFSEPEFEKEPARGLAIQAYLKDSETDLAEVVSWARARRQRVTVRLVKGAYWDYETVAARQKGWPSPVFAFKTETDANFEKLSTMLLENDDAVDAAFATHNVRSIAHALAVAERRGMDFRRFEFQMLYGMAEPVKAALLQLNCRLREYCPVGELLPGMAYLVRRLLENTSNEGFLASRYARGISREELLKKPTNSPGTFHEPHGREARERVPTGFTPFQNEPPTDFTIEGERQKMRDAIRDWRKQLGQRYPLIINHKPVSTRDWLPSLNPADQKEIVGHAAQATMVEADAALAAARAAGPKWARTPAVERAAILEKTGSLMQAEKAALCALEILEAGKSWAEADADVAEAIDFCNFYAARMREMGRPERTQHVAGETNFQEWRPRGVGVIIAPWNFPLAIMTGMTAAALVAGNAVIIKPSDQTPVIAAHLMKLLMKAGLPPGAANLLTGPGGTVGAHLVEHSQVDFIAFTGSKEVGLKIWEAAGRTRSGQMNLKKVVVEMGGKNCVIVDRDADMDEAVAGCLASAFGYQGQKCSALSRLIVLEDNYTPFLQRFIAAAASMRAGPAHEPGNVIGPVISRDAQQRILKMIEAGKKEATLAWQGEVPHNPDACYVPPTIFTDVRPDSRLFREEIFGPVLAVSKARDIDKALTLANTSEFALTGGCYSRSPASIERVKAEMVCGNLYINRSITGAMVERQPFGGFRMSGGGTKAGGRGYLENFMISRVVTENCLRRGFVPVEEG
jgi:RHH-type transcriptional regulator, proline utilization regulon repressor / proline dehydrogenase / delta 1-pyrroline-5-carboxylate dehydrogenase